MAEPCRATPGGVAALHSVCVLVHPLRVLHVSAHLQVMSLCGKIGTGAFMHYGNHTH